MYQATVYQYNQQGEVLVPTRRGTSYYGPDNHKPLCAYRGLNVNFDFFLKNTDRKPQPLHNKTYTATIIDRQSKKTAITKSLIPEDYQQGKMVLKLDHEETFTLTKKLYDLVITYKETGQIGSYGGSSDQNNRITFVLEVKDGALPEGTDSITVSTFQASGDDFIGGRMEGPAQTDSRTGLQTAVVYTTNYTGVYKFQASLSLQPLTSDWFDVPSQSYTVSSQTGLRHYTFNGMYQYVKLVHTPDVSNVGTLDKIVYRS